jgi:hypothetical protein
MGLHQGGAPRRSGRDTADKLGVHAMISRFRESKPSSREEREQQRKRGELKELWFVDEQQQQQKQQQDGSDGASAHASPSSYRNRSRTVDDYMSEDINRFLPQRFSSPMRPASVGRHALRGGPEGVILSPYRSGRPTSRFVPRPDPHPPAGTQSRGLGSPSPFSESSDDEDALRVSLGLHPIDYTGSLEFRGRTGAAGGGAVPSPSKRPRSDPATTEEKTPAMIAAELDHMLACLREGMGHGIDDPASPPLLLLREVGGDEGDIPSTIQEVAAKLEADLKGFSSMAKDADRKREADKRQEDAKRQYMRKEMESAVRSRTAQALFEAVGMSAALRVDADQNESSRNSAYFDDIGEGSSPFHSWGEGPSGAGITGWPSDERVPSLLQALAGLPLSGNLSHDFEAIVASQIASVTDATKKRAEEINSQTVQEGGGSLKSARAAAVAALARESVAQHIATASARVSGRCGTERGTESALKQTGQVISAELDALMERMKRFFPDDPLRCQVATQTVTEHEGDTAAHATLQIEDAIASAEPKETSTERVARRELLYKDLDSPSIDRYLGLPAHWNWEQLELAGRGIFPEAFPKPSGPLPTESRPYAPEFDPYHWHNAAPYHAGEPEPQWVPPAPSAPFAPIPANGYETSSAPVPAPLVHSYLKPIDPKIACYVSATTRIRRERQKQHEEQKTKVDQAEALHGHRSLYPVQERAESKPLARFAQIGDDGAASNGAALYAAQGRIRAHQEAANLNAPFDVRARLAEYRALRQQLTRC